MTMNDLDDHREEPFSEKYSLIARIELLYLALIANAVIYGVT